MTVRKRGKIETLFRSVRKVPQIARAVKKDRASYVHLGHLAAAEAQKGMDCLKKAAKAFPKSMRRTGKCSIKKG